MTKVAPLISGELYIGRGEEDLRHRPAVDMQFLPGLTVQPYIDPNRWEHRRYGRRRQQDVDHVLSTIGARAGRDRGQVPDNRTLGINVGGLDQQTPADAVLRRNFCDHFFGEIATDQLPQRPIIVETTAHHAEQAQISIDIAVTILREDFTQFPVVGRPKEGKGSRQGACADASHDLELRSIAPLAPARQVSGGKSAVGASARNGKKVDMIDGGGRATP
ncbi:hypothetical protein D9M70_484130 [compost metagenome]